MAMSLRSLLLISFLILCYFYPSFALDIASIVFFTPVILLFMYLSFEHFVFLMTYLRQHEARVQNPLPRVVYVRERTNNTERALQCVLSEVWLYILWFFTILFVLFYGIALCWWIGLKLIYTPRRRGGEMQSVSVNADTSLIKRACANRARREQLRPTIGNLSG
ncbi:uncharacterized protein ASPGLDRAFT_22158 [Aspergillus glaucus CBS 516.65]|uniref:Uncharacterized protein n=1 Tax=Aspergillus glaucus CBS 516.65 TaxID=1160497 RepID=A0A1L9VXL4_ASPGL|nr:hypothetical protein ASPGLDRAFT_22158 [Aspergillus glaucus CBS 516.65]OJJ88663.1 hypothetical protein ASPGLDRAFT_22158 [Aspergillus glaucus CBS 516.65]